MGKGISDLTDKLFEQMERLGRANMSAEELDAEVRRSQAMVAVADQITENAKVSLQAAKLYAEHGQPILDHLPQIGRSST